VAVGVNVGVGVAVGVNVAVGVAVAVNVGVGVAVAVNVGVGVAVAVNVGVGVAVAVNVGVGVTTPASAGAASPNAAPNTIELQNSLVNRFITVFSPVAVQCVGVFRSFVCSLLTASRANCAYAGA
ncbi:MAG TPA: hypothetical protein VEC18_05955, partial [Myxococcota bacterium]|nr:hypothetical protein [Myxococcota bacterium]